MATKPESAAEDWQTRLAEAMEARRLSGGELARRAGFTAQYINSLKSGERGGRLTLDTARKLAHALGVSVDWLTRGEGERERLSDVFVVGPGGRAPSPSQLPDPYPSRTEAIALLGAFVAPEIVEALRAAVPDEGITPDRDYWIRYAKELARDLRRIKDDPDLNAKDAPPKSAYVPLKNKG